MTVIGIVPEPVAAALHYGVTGSADGTTFLVYDLGGGTFDISLIRMTETSVEVLAVDGDHKLGGADWDSRLFDHIVDQLIAQWGDDSVRDDEGELQELRTLTEKTKKDLSKAESKKIIRRYGGTAATVTVTREQFEEMTAELLEETIRITSRALDRRSSDTPGSAARSASCCWSAGRAGCRPSASGSSRSSPGSRGSPIRTSRWPRERRCTRRARPSGTSSRATVTRRQAPRFPRREPAGPAERPWPPGPVTEEGVHEVASRTGLDEEQIRNIAQRTVVNVLPKAVGIKLVDITKPNWEDDPEARILHRAPHRRADPAALRGRNVRRQHRSSQPAGDRDRDLGTGRRRPEPRPGGQPPGRRRGPHRGPRAVRAACRLADQHRDRRGRGGHRQAARGRSRPAARS